MANNHATGTTIDNDVDVDWNLFRERLQLGAEIFDSAPATIDLETFYNGVQAALPNVVLRLILFCFSAVLFGAWKWYAWITGRPQWAKEFWYHWETTTSCPLQGYVYSTADKTTKSWAIDELIETKRRKGVTVKVRRFEDSRHVQHMIQHKSEYYGLIDEILDRLHAIHH